MVEEEGKIRRADGFRSRGLPCRSGSACLFFSSPVPPEPFVRGSKGRETPVVWQQEEKRLRSRHSNTNTQDMELRLSVNSSRLYSM